VVTWPFRGEYRADPIDVERPRGPGGWTRVAIARDVIGHFLTTPDVARDCAQAPGGMALFIDGLGDLEATWCASQFVRPDGARVEFRAILAGPLSGQDAP
jgi:hypothetical protein